MEEKWIKVYEIEYLSKDLSRVYRNIDDEKTIEETEKLEDLVKEDIIVQQLKAYTIPYKCKWEEGLVGVGKRIRKHYFVNIFIPEDYKLKYESIKVQPKEFEKVKELDGVDLNDNDTAYEPLEKMSKIAMTIMKSIMAIAIIGLVYNIIEAMIM